MFLSSESKIITNFKSGAEADLRCREVWEIFRCVHFSTELSALWLEKKIYGLKIVKFWNRNVMLIFERSRKKWTSLKWVLVRLYSAYQYDYHYHSQVSHQSSWLGVPPEQPCDVLQAHDWYSKSKYRFDINVVARAPDVLWSFRYRYAYAWDGPLCTILRLRRAVEMSTWSQNLYLNCCIGGKNAVGYNFKTCEIDWIWRLVWLNGFLKTNFKWCDGIYVWDG